MTDPRPLEELRPARPSRRWALPLAAGGVGAAAVALVVVLVEQRLPASIPVHFDAAGQADGWLALDSFVALTMGVLVAFAVAGGAVLWGLGRSELLSFRYGETILDPLAALFAGLVLLDGAVLPIGVLLAAAGLWTPAPSEEMLLGAGLNLGALLATAAWMLRRWPAGVPGGEPSPGGTANAPGGAMRFRCTACGGSFSVARWHALGPRIARSYYLRCPRCGERGWHELEPTGAGNGP